MAMAVKKHLNSVKAKRAKVAENATGMKRKVARRGGKPLIVLTQVAIDKSLERSVRVKTGRVRELVE